MLTKRDFLRSAVLAAMTATTAKRLWLLVSTLLVLVQPAAWAEENIRKVGIVTFFSVDVASRSPALLRFMDTIRASVPGQNVTSELRSAEGKNDRYPQVVTDLIQQHVDVIYAPLGPAAVAAQQLATTVPVVFIIAANPVTLGLVKSLEKPGGNLTGVYEELPISKAREWPYSRRWCLKQ
jgi:putative ABC transport system substrate-binding protein